MKRGFVVGLWALGVLAVSLFFLRAINMRPSTVPALQPFSSLQVHPLRFFEKELFYEGVLYTKQHPASAHPSVAGGIVPHHQLASYIMADFFQRLAAAETATIIVVGPNHEELGDHHSISSDFGWQTPFGVVEPNQAVIRALHSRGEVAIDNEVAAQEHSIGGLMSYIKYYVPKATVVPIILKRGVTMEEVNSLADQLVGILHGGAVIVASVDFSHYLNSEQAQVNDEVTLQAMNQFDYRQLLLLNSDYVDSPPAIALLLKTMQLKGTVTSETLHHTNSGIIQNNRSQPTTSYFSLIFH